MTELDILLANLRRLHPLLIDLSLGRIEGLLARLDHPERRLPPVVHVAGTNGKGSVCAYLAAMLQAAGRRVHVYTSPHLVRFAERIQLAAPDGRTRPIDEERLVELLRRVAAANDGAPMTFFEITTAAAFLAFAETPADAVVLEVGLGGRLDATNVVAHPAVTVITPVSVDHGDKLGTTLAQIAGEKAGILKPGVPGIIAQQEEDGLAVIRQAAARVQSPLAVWGEDFYAFQQRGRLVYQSEARLLDLARPKLIGPHQIINAGTAVAAALALGDPALDERAIDRGLAEVEWPARMQRITAGPLAASLKPGSELWLDGGHNPAGGMAIAETLADLEERAPKPLHLIVGMLANKDARGFLQPFRGLARTLTAIEIPGASDQSTAVSAIREAGKALGFAVTGADGIEAAVSQAARAPEGPHRIVICGSLYLAGEVLGLELGVAPQPN
jgi:dihydrofolate synthase/folylpolyglutamate synthase